MAILWQTTVRGTRYEVRAAGATRRLYTNGVFHSQYNPRHKLTRGVWDLLLLAAFFQPLARVRRVLVLGVGGGAVIRQLQEFVKPETIIGVDNNPVHLSVARRFFGVPKKTRLVTADAVRWVQRYRGPCFDLVIDDLFGHEGGDADRAVPADASWCRALLRCLARHGVLAMNFPALAALQSSALLRDHALAGRGARVYSLRTALDENAVAVLARQAIDAACVRGAIRQFPELDTRRKTTRLNYSIRSCAPAWDVDRGSRS